MVEEDSPAVVASSSENKIALWEVDTSKKLFRLKASHEAYRVSGQTFGSLCWEKNNTILVAASTQGHSLTVLRCDDNKQLSAIEQSPERERDELVTRSCFMANGEQLLIGCASGMVQLWKNWSGHALSSYQGHSSAITALCTNARNNLLISGAQAGTLLIHKTSSPQPCAQLMSTGTKTEVINQLQFSPYERAMAGSCGSSGAVRLWSVESQRMLASFPTAHPGGASDVAFSPFNRMLMASVGADEKIALYDILQRKMITQVKTPVPMSSLLLLRDGATLVAGGSDGKLYMYNLRKCKAPEGVGSCSTAAVTCLVAARPTRTEEKLSSGGFHSRKGSKKSKQSVSQHHSDQHSLTRVTFRDGEDSSPACSGDSSTAPPRLSNNQAVTDKSSAIQPFSITTPASVTPDASGVFSPLENNGVCRTSQARLAGGPMVSFTSDSNRTSFQTSSSLSVSISDASRQSQPLFTPLSSGNILFTPGTSLTTPSNPLSCSTMSIFSPLDSAAWPITLTGSSTAPDHVTVRRPVHALATVTEDPLAAGIGIGELSITTSRSINSSSTIPRESQTAMVVGEQPPSRPPPVSTLLTGSDSKILPSHPPVTQSTPLIASGELQSTTVPLAQQLPRLPQAHPLPVTEQQLQAPSQQLLTQPTSQEHQLPAPHLQYLEELIRDSREEIIESNHHDVRQLCVDMLRQFAILKNQMILALTAINQKVEKLQEDVDDARIQLNRLTPRY